MIGSLTEAILNANKGIKNNKGSNPGLIDLLYSPWEKRWSFTIGDFYNDFVAERLPDPAIVMQWHDMLVKYSERKGAIFPVRAGNTSKKLRRGWLVRVDDGFSYMLTDNDLAAYIYKMALDGYCPPEDEFYKFMTEFVKPDQIEWLAELNKNPRKKKTSEINNPMDQNGIKERMFLRMPVHFNKIGGPGPDKSEDEKNAYINTAPAPACCLGEYNYKHAHLLDVAGQAYAIPGKSIYDFESIKEYLQGNDADYQWDDTISNYVWKRKLSDDTGEVAFTTIEEIVKAQFFRFLDPINHFLAPMGQQNKYTKTIAGEKYPALDIAEYENLQKYIISQKRVMFGKQIPGSPKTYFDDFKDRTCAPDELYVIDPNAGAEEINVVYHEKSLSKETYGDKVRPSEPKKTPKPPKTGKTKSATVDVPVILTPSDPDLFKAALLKSKRAELVWVYSDGTKEVCPWRADKFNAKSGVLDNIKTRTRYTERNTNGLVEVRATVL